MSFAQDLDLTADGVLAAGEAVTFEVADAMPGEPVWFFAGDPGLTCPPSLGGRCLDLGPLRPIRRVFADALGVAEITVTVPPALVGRSVQALSPSGTSAPLAVTAPSGIAPAFSGMLVVCAGDVGDVMVEYIGDADQVTATAFQGGLEVISHDLTLVPGVAGAVFFWAEALGVSAPTCSQLTWVYEATGPSGDACAVKGPDAATMLAGLPAHCVHF